MYVPVARLWTGRLLREKLRGRKAPGSARATSSSTGKGRHLPAETRVVAGAPSKHGAKYTSKVEAFGKWQQRINYAHGQHKGDRILTTHTFR